MDELRYNKIKKIVGIKEDSIGSILTEALSFFEYVSFSENGVNYFAHLWNKATLPQRVFKHLRGGLILVTENGYVTIPNNLITENNFYFVRISRGSAQYRVKDSSKIRSSLHALRQTKPYNRKVV